MRSGRADTAEDPAGSLLGGAGAGAFGFLCVLATGAVLLLAAKLQVPDLGAGASPAAIFETIAMIGLAALGAPVEVGRAEVMVVPLGAVAVVCLGIASTVRRTWPNEIAGDRGLGAAHIPIVVATAATLAVLCALSAWRFSVGEVAVDPLGAAAAGGWWGIVGPILAMASPAPRRMRDLLFGRWSHVRRPWAAAGAGLTLWLALAALVSLGVLAVARVLFRTGAALGSLGSLVHGLAFAPNLAAAGASIALGASVDAGFGSLAASDDVPAYSLFDWAGGAPPVWVWLSPFVVLVCVVGAGARLARVYESRSAGAAGVARALAGAAVAFAVGLGVLVLAGEARAGIVENEGFARLAADPIEVFFLALGWAAVGLPLGWAVERFVRRKREPQAR